jgi:threonine dehydratase
VTDKDKKISVHLQQIQEAQKRICDVVQITRLEKSLSASSEAGCDVYFKFENEQRTGSFKIRGALNKFRLLQAQGERRGIVASSAGNHAQGVALAAREAGLKAKIVMPLNSPMVKQVATRAYGAEVLLHGQIYDEAFAKALELARDEGLLFVPPFEDPDIIAGQGTLGLELIEAVPELDSVILPIGGGGLISGVAVALKALKPSIKIFGVVAENAPGMRDLFHHKKSETAVTSASIADGISVKVPSPVMFKSFIEPLVDEIVSIPEDQIAEAILFLLERAKTVVEGSGAVTFAALRHGRLNLGRKTCVVLSGGNIDMNLVAQILDRGLTHSGRRARIAVVVDDRPGILNRLTKVFSDHGVNILDVHHDRTAPSLRVRETLISFTVESKSEAHIAVLAKALKDSGIVQRVV